MSLIRNQLLTPELTAAFKRLPRYARLAWNLARDPRVSPQAKAILAGGVLYSVSPIDLVPGFVPVIGQLDDLLVLLSSMSHALRSLGPEAAAALLLEAGITEAELAADRAALAEALRVAAKEAWRYSQAGAQAAGRVAAQAGVTTARLAGQAGRLLWRAGQEAVGRTIRRKE